MTIDLQLFERIIDNAKIIIETLESLVTSRSILSTLSEGEFQAYATGYHSRGGVEFKLCSGYGLYQCVQYVLDSALESRLHASQGTSNCGIKSNALRTQFPLPTKTHTHAHCRIQRRLYLLPLMM